MDFIDFADPGTPAIDAWRKSINGEAKYTKVPPCALAAIVANETGGRNILQEGVPPGPGCGVGLCQVTSGVDWSSLQQPTYNGFHLMDPGANLYVAAEYFLGPAISFATKLKAADEAKFAAFGDGQILFYAMAAYNEGETAVRDRFESGQNPDNGTTDGYAARAMAHYLAFVAVSHEAAVP
jgi:hypothetical protein